MEWLRPLTMLVLVIAIITGFFMGKIDAVAFFGFATGLVVWWYKSRDEAKNK